MTAAELLQRQPLDVFALGVVKMEAVGKEAVDQMSARRSAVNQAAVRGNPVEIALTAQPNVFPVKRSVLKFVLMVPG
jgi:hypothetical protein